MEVRDASLYEDIVKIASIPPTHPEFAWTVNIFTPAGQVELDDVMSLTIGRDYAKNFSDQSMLNFQMGIASFTQNIYPYKENLRVEILRKPIIRGTRDTLDQATPVSKLIYRAILVDQSSLGLRASSELTTDVEKGDRSKRIPVQLQLVEPLLDEVRTRFISGIFAGSWTNILKCLCRGKLREEPWNKDVNLELVHRHQQQELAGVDVREPDNQNSPKQFIVRKGTRLIELPDFIQNKYGLYNHSLGSYIERGEWYIWGLHNTGLYHQSERTLTIAVVDANVVPATDNSFSVEGKHVKAVATGNIQHLDNTESLLQNMGNGVRYQDANKLIDSYAQTVNGKTTISRASNVREYLVEERKDGLNHVPYTEAITGNHYKEVSRLNERRGTIAAVEWHNSDPDVLRPGMPTKVLYMDANEVKSIEGILVGAQHAYAKDTANYTDTRVRCTSALSIWLNRDVTA